MVLSRCSRRRFLRKQFSIRPGSWNASPTIKRCRERLRGKVTRQEATDTAKCRNLSEGKNSKIEIDGREGNKRLCARGSGEISGFNGTRAGV